MIVDKQTTITRKPNQLVPISKKLGEGEEAKAWRKGCLDYFLSKNSIAQDKQQYYRNLYKAAQGFLSEMDYNYVTNPFNQNQTKRYPAKLRNYDIVSPIIQLLMGEFSKRIFKPSCTAINSDIETVRQKALNSLFIQQLEQSAINTFNELGINTGQQNQEIQGIDVLQEKVKTIKDRRSEMGQNALNYIVVEQEVHRKFRESFYDFLVTGYAITEKGVAHDNVYLKSHGGLDVGFYGADDETFLEDGECAWIKKRKTVSDILDVFHDKLTEKEIKWIDQLDRDQSNDYTLYDNDTETRTFLKNMSEDHTYLRNHVVNADNKHEVAYCTWKSKTILYKVEGVDIYGQPYSFEAGEGYKKLPNEKVTKTWVNEVWHGWRIAHKLYVGIEPIEYQRGTFDNPSACKLPINGRNIFGRHYYTKSPVEKLMPFQQIYNIIKWQAEKTMNKNKDKFLTMPKELIPHDEDMDMFDMIYHADADQFLFLDEIDRGRVNAAQYGLKVIDVSLREYINFLFNTAQLIKLEAEETLGINRQRKGNAMASDLKGVTDQAIYQSAIISEEVFLEFEEFEDRDLNGLVDISKYAYRNGRKRYFLDADKRRQLLDIDGAEYTETDYAITVGNGRKQSEDLELLKQQAQAIIQNEGKLSTVAKLVREQNIDELINVLEAEESRMEQMQMQNIESQQQAQQAAQQFEEQKHADEIAMDKYKVDADIYLGELQVFNGNDENNKAAELAIKAEDLNIKREKLNVDREKIAASLQNKVVGEK